MFYKLCVSVCIGGGPPDHDPCDCCFFCFRRKLQDLRTTGAQGVDTIGGKGGAGTQSAGVCTYVYNHL